MVNPLRNSAFIPVFCSFILFSYLYIHDFLSLFLETLCHVFERLALRTDLDVTELFQHRVFDLLSTELILSDLWGNVGNDQSDNNLDANDEMLD